MLMHICTYPSPYLYRILTTDAQIAEWNTDGLPADQVRFSHVISICQLSISFNLDDPLACVYVEKEPKEERHSGLWCAVCRGIHVSNVFISLHLHTTYT